MKSRCGYLCGTLFVLWLLMSATNLLAQQQGTLGGENGATLFRHGDEVVFRWSVEGTFDLEADRQCRLARQQSDHLLTIACPSEWMPLRQPPPVTSPTVPSVLERATVATLFGSSSVSMVPVWITAACTTAGTCREANPVMAHLIGEGPVRAIVMKAGVSAIAHYAVWRLAHQSKKERIMRLVLAATLLGINTYDAVHDIRVYRRLPQR